MPFSLSAIPQMFPATRDLFLLCHFVGMFVVFSTDIPLVHTLTTSPLSASSVDFDYSWWERLAGQAELVESVESHTEGRVEGLESLANALGAGLAVMILACLFLWGMTGYAWWRLRMIYDEPIGYKPSPMTAPMMPRMQAFPSMASMPPQPTGPRLVSQKVMGMPGGPGPVQYA